MTLSLVGMALACVLAPVPSDTFLLSGISGCVGSSPAWGMFLGLSRSKHGSLETTSKPRSLCWWWCQRPEVRAPLRPSSATSWALKVCVAP